jgi:tetratricopeptide (TPR) repeat protein
MEFSEPCSEPNKSDLITDVLLRNGGAGEAAVNDPQSVACLENEALSDEDHFVDALDSLTLDSHVHVISDRQDDAPNPKQSADEVIESTEASNDAVADLLASEAESDEDHNDADPKIADADAEAVVIDEEVLREQEASLTDEEKQLRRQEALRLKELGNSYFAESRFEAAIVAYTDALAECLLCHNTDRAIIYANRAAAKMRLEKNEAAIADCTKALEFNPDYMKALLRRAELREKSDKLDEALEDYTKALERDPSLHNARAACMRLPDKIKERNEKMKDEMLGKLKDLGNMILRPFGLSTDNFKLQQDPATGSYSVNFQQNVQQNNGT